MKSTKKDPSTYNEIFEELKRDVSRFDPVAFAENYLLLDSGNRFDLSGNGWKYMADLWRYVTLQADNRKAKPIIELKGRQVGATTKAGALGLFFTTSGLYGTEAGKSPIRVMHLFPSLKHVGTYTKEKLGPMIRNSVDGFITSRSLQNDKNAFGKIPDDTLSEKFFVGENMLRVDSIGTNADRIRGSTQDVILFDEVQDMNKKAIENAKKIAQHAKYGGRAEGLLLFFGTPKNSGSHFWTIWNASDQRFYQLRCTSCEDYFFLYTLEDDSWNDIWVKEQEVRCPHCSFHQDKRDAVDGGRWVPTRVTKDGARIIDYNQNKPYVGFHHNLMLMPLFLKEDVLKSWPKFNPNATERAWKNETLGDFFRGGGLPLTMEDIIENALDETRGTAKTIGDRTGKTLVLGMDWGGIDDNDEEEGITQGQSYTTAVVLSINTSGVFTIENAFKLKKNDLMYHVDVVDKLFKTYRIHQAVADLGYGQQTVRYMQLDMGYKNRFLGCYNSGNINKQFSYDHKHMRVTVNKDQMIEEVFDMIRRGRIRFPAQGLAWEQLHWLAEHCTSMETITRIKNENVVKKYIKGAKPNDGLMALMYAVIAYKYLSTGAFKTLDEEHGTSRYPKPILGYAPNMR
jgi:hypothetical protein